MQPPSSVVERAHQRRVLPASPTIWAAARCPSPKPCASRWRIVSAPGSSGPVAMLAHPRTWGWLFNPVTLYYCFDPTGTGVEALVAEVTNTPWHERHAYVVGGPGTHHFDKALHVSPFFGMDLHYELSYRAPGQHLPLRISTVRDGSYRLRRRPAPRSKRGQPTGTQPARLLTSAHDDADIRSDLPPGVRPAACRRTRCGASALRAGSLCHRDGPRTQNTPGLHEAPRQKVPPCSSRPRTSHMAEPTAATRSFRPEGRHAPGADPGLLPAWDGRAASIVGRTLSSGTILVEDETGELRLGRAEPRVRVRVHDHEPTVRCYAGDRSDSARAMSMVGGTATT